MKQLYHRLLLEFIENPKTSWGKVELVNFIKDIYIEELEKMNASTRKLQS